MLDGHATPDEVLQLLTARHRTVAQTQHEALPLHLVRDLQVDILREGARVNNVRDLQVDNLRERARVNLVRDLQVDILREGQGSTTLEISRLTI